MSLDEESTLTKDCNISRTDLNAIESVSGVSTMQNSYESSGRTGALVGGKSSFEEESSPPPPTPPSTGAPTEEERNAGKELINTTITTGVTAPNDTFELPEAEAERLLAGKLLLNGGGTYDARFISQAWV